MSDPEIETCFEIWQGEGTGTQAESTGCLRRCPMCSPFLPAHELGNRLDRLARKTEPVDSLKWRVSGESVEVWEAVGSSAVQPPRGASGRTAAASAGLQYVYFYGCSLFPAGINSSQPNN